MLLCYNLCIWQCLYPQDCIRNWIYWQQINYLLTVFKYAICIFKSLGNSKGSLLDPWSFLMECKNHSAVHSFATISCINRSILHQMIFWEWVHPLCENWMKFPGSFWEFTSLTMDRCPISPSHWGVGSCLRGVNEMWQQHHAALVNCSVWRGPNVWFLL